MLLTDCVIWWLSSPFWIASEALNLVYYCSFLISRLPCQSSKIKVVHKILRSGYLHHFISHLTSIQSDHPSGILLIVTQCIQFPILVCKGCSKQSQHLRKPGCLQCMSCDGSEGRFHKHPSAFTTCHLYLQFNCSSSVSSTWVSIASLAVWTKDNQSQQNQLLHLVSSSSLFHCIQSISISSCPPACPSESVAVQVWPWTHSKKGHIL
jgi:hypothetical protein